MKSVGTLRKKGLGGADFLSKKEKSKNSSTNASGASLSPVSNTHTTSPSIKTTGGSSSHKSLHLSRKSVYTTTPKSSLNAQQQQVPQVPITVDLHRFADDNLQPEECKAFSKSKKACFNKIVFFLEK
jgi:hypothetical protein